MRKSGSVKPPIRSMRARTRRRSAKRSRTSSRSVKRRRAGKRSTATAQFYRVKAGYLVRVFHRDAAGNTVPFRLIRLHASDVERYISVRRDEGASENTIAKELVTLRAALKLALRSGQWNGNLAAVMPIGFAPEYKPRKRFLSRQEVETLVG
jgi:site-specific recombinase XerD